jgi:hypothetical protein
MSSSSVAVRQSSRWTSGPAIVAYVALAKFVLHLVFQNYDYFRDELYFLACADHLAWGYVDQPPAVAALVKLSTTLFGTSLIGIHILPAFAGALKILLTGMIVRELGGQRFAQFLAAIAVLFAPVYLSIDAYISMNCLEPLWWMGCVYLLLRMINGASQKLWLGFGALAGLGLQTKYSIGFFGFGIVVGLLLTEHRRMLAKPWIYFGGVIAAVVFFPNLWWQYTRDWPFLELMANIRASGRDVQLSPIRYILEQLLLMGPPAAPLWIGGLIYLFTTRMKQYRVLGWTFVITITCFIVLHGKNYYINPAYPMLFAAGAIAFERWALKGSQSFGARGSAPRLSALTWVRAAYVVLLIVLGALFLPYTLSILSPPKFIAYMDVIGIRAPASETHRQSPLPQQYADMFGWREMTEKVAAYYNALPQEERAKTAIFGNDYGEAGAIDFFGPKYGLPKAISGHQNYWYWGPRNYTGESVIIIGEDDVDALRNKWCQSVTLVAELNHPYAIPYENRPIWHCRGMRVNLQQVWPKLKRWG